MAGIDNTLSSLAKKLDPYIRAIVSSMFGTGSASAGAIADSGYTLIQGRKLYKDDMSGTRNTTTAVDIGVYSSYTSALGAQADKSSVLGGYNNDIESTGIGASIVGGANNDVDGQYSAAIAGYACLVTGESSLAAGNGANQPNDYGFAFGNEYDYKGDIQASTYVFGDWLTMSSSWQPISSNYATPTAGLLVGYDTHTVWTFSALITGIELNTAKLYSYKIEGTVKKLATTPAIVQSIVTTFYTDDANFGVRVNSSSDLFRFEVVDTGNSSRTVKWVVKCDTAEVAYNIEVT